MFVSAGLVDMPPNVLVLQIQPEEAISISFQAKYPGSKICINTLNMNFSYSSIFGVKVPQAYQRLLLDCMLGDQTLFTRQDDVEASWRLLTPILHVPLACFNAFSSDQASSQTHLGNCILLSCHFLMSPCVIYLHFFESGYFSA